ncbi:transglutaminase domain-containing protein [Pelotomaculum propionicicum]|uniref:transglutaminase domain-containing protein n=1 Tax=Pelotomaculum propionicicum TaxID=258475 RepID=UPI003B78ADD8
MKLMGFTKKALFISTVILVSLLIFSVPASAGYSIGFSNSVIQISSPSSSGFNCEGNLTIEGTSDLDQVWFCVRGPAGDLITHPADVQGGSFKLNIELRFGPGKYTIWAGDNPTRFDGVIRFELNNKLDKDTRYISPSAYVDSDNQLVIDLANQIVMPQMGETEKVKAIHDWVAGNIAYDYNAFLEGDTTLIPASQTLKSKKGVCRDYSFLVAALARAAGLQAKVVHGQTWESNGWTSQSHAWNEVYADGKWVTVDATWDAGYIQNNSFVAAPSTKYFAPDSEDFAVTHFASAYTSY